MCYKHSWLSFPVLEINKSFLDLIKVKCFGYATNPLSAKPVGSRSRWIIASLAFLMNRWPTMGEKELGEYLAFFPSPLDKNTNLFAFTIDRIRFSFSFQLLVSLIKRPGNWTRHEFVYKGEPSFSYSSMASAHYFHFSWKNSRFYSVRK